MNANIAKAIAAAIIAAIVIAIAAWGCTHLYRADGVVSSIVNCGIVNEVFIDLDNGHRYSFYEDGSDKLYKVGYDVSVVMYNNGTDDPTDDRKFF